MATKPESKYFENLSMTPYNCDFNSEKDVQNILNKKKRD